MARPQYVTASQYLFPLLPQEFDCLGQSSSIKLLPVLLPIF
jgi:hypothetical protein